MTTTWPARLDEAIERSAQPAAVRTALATLADAGRADRLIDDPDTAIVTITVMAASRSLTRLLIRDPLAVETVADLDRRAPVDLDNVPAWRHREYLRIAARDLIGTDRLEVTGRLLADLADDVLAAAVDGIDDLAVIAMGKAGAQELNYASDVDVVFVGSGDPRPVMQRARECFRIDADLRPEGRNGPLTRSLDSYKAYWDTWAEPWEFQALLKARHAAGDPELGAAFMDAAQEMVWGRPFDADAIRSIRHMKARVESEIARRGLGGRELKRGPGGIRDVEFAVQLLQLVHGRQDRLLRDRATLDALSDLANEGYVALDDAHALDRAYRFLRAVEHRLQIVDEQQVHTVPANDTARSHLARVLGYRDDPDRTALARFDAELVRHQATARGIHERLYFRPLLEAFTRPPGTHDEISLTPEAVRQRLAAFGFTDAERTQAALIELTRGLTRSSHLMQQLLPLLLRWLSDSPDPDLGLLGLRILASGPHRSGRLVEAFRESAESARRLCLLLGTSRLITAGFEHEPTLIAQLARDDLLVPPSRDDLLAQVRSAMGQRIEGRRPATLLRFKQIHQTRIAAADVLDLADQQQTAQALTDLAEVVLAAALDLAEPTVPMAVIAMGRMGGRELAYASDLDVVLAHAGTGAADQAEAEAAATRFLQLVKGTTPASRVWDLDLDLRPEGKQGRLAVSLDAWRTYHEKWALTWERQALVRARAVAGDPEVGRAFGALVEDVVWRAPFTDDQAREVRRIKARVERERIPAGEDPEFHLKLGKGALADVEWTAQLLQLQHGVRGQSTMAALDALVAKGVLAEEDAAVLAESWRYCEHTRSRWQLVKGGPANALPQAPEPLGKLARSLGTTGRELREQHKRLTRRARAVVERVFYGTPDGL